jgi:hypothetical protein
MGGMKNHLIALVVIGLGCSVMSASAAPLASSHHGMEYLVNDQELAPWSAGLQLKGGERRLEWAFGGESILDLVNGRFVLGYDVLRWVTAYGVVGITDAKLDNVDAEDDERELGAGLRFNLLNQEIMDPPLTEDRLLVSADVYYGTSEAAFFGRTYEWEEFTAELTVSIVNDTIGNRYYWPRALALYVGPAYSNLESDDFEAAETFGFVGGLEIYYTRRVTLGMGVQHYSESAYSGNVTIRF